MALLWADPLDYTVLADFVRVYPLGSIGSASYRQPGLGGGYCMGSLDYNDHLTLREGPLDGMPAEGVFSFASRGPCDYNAVLMYMLQGVNDQWNIFHGSHGLFAIRNGADTVQDEGTFIIRDAGWHYFSVEFLTAQTGGYVKLYIDGVLDCSWTGADTQQQSTPAQDGIKLNGAMEQYDHLVLMDATGSYNNSALLAPWYVETIQPDGDGNYGDFSPLGAGSQYVEVDEENCDEDTSYTESNTPGHIVSFSTANPSLGLSGTVNGIVVKSYIKPVGAARSARNMLRISSADYNGTPAVLSAYDALLIDVWEQNPAIAGLWTPTTINALETGVEITA